MDMETRIVSSLEKVFCDPVFTGERLETLSALRGERVHFQIALRSISSANASLVVDPGSFPGRIQLREVQNVPSLMPCAPEDDYIIRNRPGLFPDALVPLEKDLAISAGNWHAVWVTVDVPADMPPGAFALKFNLLITPFAGQSIREPDPESVMTETLVLTVVNAALPEQKLKVTHWFYADCIQHFYKVPAWSEEHWALLEKYFRNYAEHHNNLLLTPLWSVPLDMVPGRTRRPECQLLEITHVNGQWHFDFTRLKRWITTARQCGIQNFEMVHAFSQWGLQYAPEIIVNGKPAFGHATPLTAPEYREFLQQLMKHLLPFLRGCGVTPENCCFHISDEPPESALENYRYAATLFREILQGYPVIDALSNIRFFREGLIDRPVPDEYELEKFMPEKVAERWVYYAGEWRDGMPGRQFGMPSLRNRILGIMLYIYGCDGFLEWGYNFWFGQLSRTLDIDPWQDSNSDRSFRSGGAFLVYPGPDGPVDSLRHEVLAEAFQDEMALRLLEEKSSREAVLQWLEEKAGGPLSLRQYPRSERWLLDLRRELNQKLADLQ